MTTTTTSAARAWLPQDILDLIVTPVGAESVAAQVATYRAGLTGDSLRVPLITADPSAAWVAEGEEIPLSEAELGEIEQPYRKLAGLSVISSELAADTDPAAAQEIGNGLVRDIARKLDAAFFGTNTGNTGVQPAGLGNLTGVTVLDAPATLSNLDTFVAARFAAAAQGAELSAFVLSPGDAEELAQLKESSTSARRLLESATPGRLTLDGVPVLTSPAVTDGTSWALPTGRAVIAARQDATVETDRSAFFTSDRVAVRAVMRVAFAFPHPAAVVRINRAA